MAETTYYDSPMTGAELDEAFAGLAGMEQTAAQVAQNAETARQYGQIVADNAQGIAQISENLAEILSAADNARAAAQSAGQAAASESNADTCARQADASAAEAAEWVRQAQQIAQGALGWYAAEDALQSAHPTGENGQWAIIGSTDTIWTWDSDTGTWKNTSVKTDLSNYYTKDQASERFATAEQGTKADAAVRSVNGQYPSSAGAVNLPVGSKFTLLWTNSNTATSFSAKNVSLSLGSYDAVMVIGINYMTANGDKLIIPAVISYVGYEGLLASPYYTLRTRKFTVSSSRIAFEDAYSSTDWNQHGNVQNEFCIPYKIYGIKF